MKRYESTRMAKIEDIKKLMSQYEEEELPFPLVNKLPTEEEIDRGWDT